MYLHNFPNPAIHDYDPLTYKNRWHAKYDCILANPPFMSPKGGVQPHEQFRIRANKTEVLFSDYIIEHLNPNGKAGWIVPEGIIFQNSNDYVELRKWLINDLGLWAVVSLPAQIFQPYSGVKTSILLVDRALARLTENIILLKIENDGFSLNTNRNPIKENDLPAALKLLTEYKKDPKAPILFEDSGVKAKILHRKEFAKLDSYKSTTAAVDFCRKEFNALKKAEEKYRESLEKELTDNQKLKVEERIDNAKKIFLENTGFDSIPTDETAIKQFVEDQLKGEVIIYGENPDYHPNLSHNLKKYIDWQREYNLSFDKNANIEKGPSVSWQMERIGNLCELINGRAFKPSDWKIKADGGLPIIRIQNLNNKFAEFNYYNGSVVEKFIVNDGDLLFSWSGSKGTSFGPHIWNGGKAILNQHIFRVEHTGKIIKEYFYWALKKLVAEVEENLHGGVGLVHITKGDLEKLQIPLPPLEVQQKIVTEIEQYQKVIDGCNLVIQNYKPNFRIDESWEKKKLDEVCDIITDGTHLKPTYVESGIKFLSSKNVTSGIIDWNDIKYISEKEHKLLSKRANPQRNDILLAKNGTTGIAALNDTDEVFDIYVSLALLRPTKEIYPLFLLHVLNSDIVKEQFNSRLKGVGVPNLHLNEIKEVQIHFPPIEEQHSIVNQIQSEMQAVEQCKSLKTQMENKIKEVIDSVWQSNSSQISK